MKILYTQKGNTVYIDDDKAEKFNGHTLYENNGRIRVYKGKDCGTLPKFLFDYGEDVISRRKNIDIYDFRKSNMIFKQRATVYRGVSLLKVKGKEYYTAYYYMDSKKVNLGYYTNDYDAAIAREYTIRKNKLKVTPTGISLSDTELSKEYIRVEEEKEKRLLEGMEIRKKALIDIANSRRDISYGIIKNGEKLFYVLIKTAEKKVTFGSYDTYEKAAIIRNCYIIENRLDRKLVPLDIPIEKQFELRKSIRSVLEIRAANKNIKLEKKMAGRKYKGINTQKNNGICRYVVQVRTKTGVAYVGSSRDIDAAAMMYNIYVIEKSITDKIINDVGLTIEQQYRYLDYKGYTFNGEKFNKNKIKSISKKEPT